MPFDLSVSCLTCCAWCGDVLDLEAVKARGIITTSDEGKRDGFNVIRVLCREACECGAVECTVRMALASK